MRAETVKRVERGFGCVTAVLAVPLAIVVVLVGYSTIASSWHEHAARKDLDRRARSYADALGESYAKGQTDEAAFRTLAATVGGGRLGTVKVTSGTTDTVVAFDGEETYSTPGSGWGGSVIVCYQATLKQSTPSEAKLETVTC
jgi:hypothetical protein